MEDLAFALPVAALVWAAVACLGARRADPVRAAAWAWLAGGACVGLAVAVVSVIATAAGAGLTVALYGGGLTSAALLGGILVFARIALPGLRPDGLIDTVIASVVVLALAVRIVVVPGFRDGDAFLTTVFCVDVLGFVIAASIAVGAASQTDRRLGRPLAFAAFAATVGDGFVAAAASGDAPAAYWPLAVLWALGAGVLAAAAQRAGGDPPGTPLAETDPGLRWVLGRVLLPFAAVLTLPVAAIAMGDLAGWGVVYFGAITGLVLTLAFARQGYLLLDNVRSARRERGLRQEVQHRHDERLEQSIRDPLTGSYNRRFLFAALEKEVQRSRRYESEAALILFDVDDFKSVNDTYGHATGDEALRRVTQVIEPLMRPSDSFARIGGEEFAVLLPETSQLEALMVADRLRTAVARARILEGRRVTLSGGVGSCPGDADTREELLRRTDAALYWAKRNGKDLCALTSDAITEEIAGGGLEEVARGAHLYGLVASIDGQSRHTRDHSENVAAYASALGQALGLERERMIVLRRAALLHDIGKVAVPVGILSKTERLTDADYEEIKRHSWVGSTMLVRAGMEVEARFVGHHHERFDGAGYPDRIGGEDIPFEARILFVCDSFEAMTSDRAYRPGMPVADAVAELERCAGTQFDPRVVEAFRGLLERGELQLALLRSGAAPAPAA